jgi:RNA polymerase sigma-70 factor (ECF subfamily)
MEAMRRKREPTVYDVAPQKSTFDRFVEQTKHDVYRYVLGVIRDVHDAEDVVSEVFYRLYRGLAQFDGTRASFKTWFFTIVANTVRTALRRRKLARLWPLGLRRHRGDDDAVEEPAEAGSAQALESGLVTDEVFRNVNKLPARQREVFLLRVVQCLSVRETAMVLRSSEGSVKVNLYKATQRLRKELKHVL